jgi:putative transposase
VYIKKDNLGKWYAVLVSELKDIPSIKPKIAIGADVGLTNMAMLSTGESIQYPKYYIETEKKLAAVQRDLSRKQKGSKNRQKARLKVAKVHQRIMNRRAEFLHKVSRKLVDSADLIVFENLNISGMLKNRHLAKFIQDHAWGKLIQFTQDKAAKAGKEVELVEAKYTSQKCSQCGIMVPKTLADRGPSLPYLWPRDGQRSKCQLEYRHPRTEGLKPVERSEYRLGEAGSLNPFRGREDVTKGWRVVSWLSQIIKRL